MKVFISWSGPQSNYIAQALRDWLLDVIPTLDPWMSERDIGAGERWGNKLWNELQDSQFGVVCLTAENLESTWLHYEAGALAKTVDRRVCPYLYKIDPSVVQGPLSEFQWKQVDEQGTKELLRSINDTSNTLTKTGLRPGQLDRAFETWWPQLEKKLNDVPASTTAAPPQRKTEEMLEELLEIGRSLARAAASAKEERREMEAASTREWRRRRMLERLDKQGMTFPLIDPDSRDMTKRQLLELADRLQKLLQSRSAGTNLEPSISEEPPPPSDTPQEEKPPSK